MAVIKRCEIRVGMCGRGCVCLCVKHRETECTDCLGDFTFCVSAASSALCVPFIVNERACVCVCVCVCDTQRCTLTQILAENRSKSEMCHLTLT